MNVTFILLYLLSFAIIWQFAGYPSLMAVAALKSKPKPKDKDYSFQPFVSVIVPTYNVIAKRMKNLVDLNYSKDKYKILEVDSNILAGTNAESILSKTKEMINRDNNWNNPFGDGKAGERIVEVIMGKSQ